MANQGEFSANIGFPQFIVPQLFQLFDQISSVPFALPSHLIHPLILEYASDVSIPSFFF